MASLKTYRAQVPVLLELEKLSGLEPAAIEEPIKKRFAGMAGAAVDRSQDGVDRLQSESSEQPLPALWARLRSFKRLHPLPPVLATEPHPARPSERIR